MRAGRSLQLALATQIRHAKNDRVAKWYAGYGALALLDAPLSLVLLAVAADALKRGGAAT